MTANLDLLASAMLAEAAYAEFLQPNGQLKPLADIRAALVAKDWSGTQVDAFLANYRVIHQQPNTATGFSATLFEKLTNGLPTGQYVFATRGTEFGVQLRADAPLGLDLAADIGDLVLDGLAWSQIVDMYNYWKRLTTPPGLSYQQAQVVTLPLDAGLAAGTYIRDGGTTVLRRIELVPATDGIGAIGTGAPLQVAGHSLGGHLASAFTRLFPNVASQAYSINGAGYAEILGNANINYVFSALGGGDWFSAADVQNFYGSAGPDIVTQNAPNGLVQVGAHDMIYIERGGQGENPLYWYSSVWGHSATQMSDSAAVYDLLIRLDARSSGSPSQFLPQLLPIFEAAAKTRGHTLEGVVEGLARFFGVDGSTIAEDNREALHARIKLVKDSAAFQALAGKLRIEPTHDWLTAQTDFAALLSLTTGATFSLRLNDPSPASPASLALYGVHRSEYERWLADRNVRATDANAEYRGRLNYSSTYLAARTAFLNTLIAGNAAKEGLVSSAAVTRRITFEDCISVSDRSADQVMVLQPGSGSYEQQRVVFGSSGNDSIYGEYRDEGLSGVNTPNEFLFGGDGNHYIYGNAGREVIEGGAGDDVLYGGSGFDLALGGAGDDTLVANSGLLNGDTLLGGRSTDTNYFERGATQNGIFDSDGLGSVVYGGAQLVGGNGLLSQASGNTQIFQSPYFTYKDTVADLEAHCLFAPQITVSNRHSPLAA